MRPPQNAGGIRSARRCSRMERSGFNEAPAKRGGDYDRVPLQAPAPDAASMRPPQNAGGIGRRGAQRVDGGRRFNEAPAKRGGDFGPANN